MPPGEDTILGNSAPTDSATPNPAPADPAKPADPAPPASADAASKDTPKGAPESYEAFKTPEGVSLDEDVATEFKSLAKGLNLTQADAQRVFDLGLKQAERISDSLAAKTAEAQVKWATDAKADKEFGGEKLAENIGVAAKAMEQFASPELQSMLRAFDPKTNPNGASLGNHPEVIRLFYRIGKAMSEDKFVPGGTKPAADPSSPYFSYPKSDHK